VTFLEIGLDDCILPGSRFATLNLNPSTLTVVI